MKCFSHRVNALAGRLNRHKDYIRWKSLKSVCLVVFIWCDWTCGLKRDGSGWWESLYKYTSPGWILYHPVCGCQPRELLVADFFHEEEILQPWNMLQNIIFVFQKCEWPMTAPSSSFWLQHYYIFSQLHLRRIILYFLFCDITSETENGHDAKVALPINGRGCGSFTSLISWENSHKN